MIIKFARALLRLRWLMVASLALAVIVFEVYEHRHTDSSPANFRFCGEILILGLALPLLLGKLLSVLANIGLESIDIRNIVPKRIQHQIKQRVLVIENNLLLGASVESLLLQEISLDVIGISPRDEQELIRKVRCLQPEVVILDEASYLTHSIRLLAMLRKDHQLRLVIVNADKNFIQVYHKQNVFLTQGSDLIKVLLEIQSPLF